MKTKTVNLAACLHMSTICNGPDYVSISGRPERFNGSIINQQRRLNIFYFKISNIFVQNKSQFFVTKHGCHYIEAFYAHSSKFFKCF